MLDNEETPGDNGDLHLHLGNLEISLEDISEKVELADRADGVVPPMRESGADFFRRFHPVFLNQRLVVGQMSSLQRPQVPHAQEIGLDGDEW